MMVGQATAFAPDYNKAVLAAARVFRLLDRRPLIDSQGQSGVRLVSSVKEGLTKTLIPGCFALNSHQIISQPCKFDTRISDTNVI